MKQVKKINFRGVTKLYNAYCLVMDKEYVVLDDENALEFTKDDKLFLIRYPKDVSVF
jgi:hypothetical protein